MPRRHLNQGWLVPRTYVHHKGATRREGRTFGRVQGAEDFSGQSEILMFFVGMGRERRREQRLRVGMDRVGAQFRCVAKLDNLPQVHDSYLVADVSYGSKIVADEPIADHGRSCNSSNSEGFALLQLGHSLLPLKIASGFHWPIIPPSGLIRIIPQLA